MTLVELLIALSISSALLIAIAAAFHASAGTITHNDSYFRCTQSARGALVEMTTEIRRADAAQVNRANDAIQIIRPAGLLAPREVYRQFKFDPSRKRITVQMFQTGNLPGPIYELASNVTACTFGPPEMGTDSNHMPIAILIPIRITCSIGENSVTLTGAAAALRRRLLSENPRRSWGDFVGGREASI